MTANAPPTAHHITSHPLQAIAYSAPLVRRRMKKNLQWKDRTDDSFFISILLAELASHIGRRRLAPFTDVYVNSEA